jgi:hypothetical protein
MRQCPIAAGCLLAALAAVPGCGGGQEEPKAPAPTPQAKTPRRSRSAEHPSEPKAAPKSCKWKPTDVCNLPKDEERILASCDPPQHDVDAHGCATLAAFRVCNPSIVDGPRFEHGECCYGYCQPPSS